MSKISKIKIIFFLGIIFGGVLFPAKCSHAEIIPPSRRVTWQGNVGVLGGIPNRTTICATLSPSGGDDYNLIQNAINACPSGPGREVKSGDV